MANVIKIDIDQTTLNAILAQLQNATTMGGGGVGVGVGGRQSLVGGTGHASAPRQQYGGGIVQAQPGGNLPSIPRGIRTTMGLMPGGYELVATYQKVLWLEQGLNTAATKGFNMASMMELYTFGILILIDVLRVVDELKRNEEIHKQEIMNLSDIHKSMTYKQWERYQNNPYRGRKP